MGVLSFEHSTDLPDSKFGWGLDGCPVFCQVIGNPSPAANVNFGQGIGVTSAGQIAVGAFGADGGFGALHLFTSISAGEDLSLLNKQPFADTNLQSCVLGQAATNGWATVSEVSGLDCSDSSISDLTGLDALSELTTLDLSNNDLIDITGLENLTNLTSLNLTGNEGILCADLDALELVLGAGVVIRPTICDAGGGGTQASEVQSLHNALGQRVVKTVDGVAASAIHFIYDQAGQVIAEIDSSTGQTLREYVYVNGLQVALVDDTGTQDEATYFVQNDHLGTPQKITGTLQQVVWAGSYEPFGEVDETVAVIENNIRFPGQYEDGETGLHYNYFRDYDPGLGRYVESDPIGLDGGENVYGYANNNPYRYTDQYGLASVRQSALSPAAQFFISRGFGPFGGQCGPSDSKLRYWAPDSIWTPACKQHDNCYGTCGKSQWECDWQFTKQSGNAPYSLLVILGGKRSYDLAQDEAGCNEC